MTRRRMTSWYNPLLLVQTAIRVAISTIFGQFADKREAMAATNAIAEQPFDESFDYSGSDNRDESGDLWFDYAADTGDGWDSTFAVFRLLAAERVDVEGAGALPRGRLLVLGGDQVYPTASRPAYGDRLLEPMEEASKRAAKASGWPEPKPDLYVLPGNHDWYDGLASFFGLFCRRSIKGANTLSEDNPGRLIGGWQTQQTRSYFAIRLSSKWWLWGTDAQLGGYIDQPQLDFFRHVAKRWMKPGSKLILCVGDPAWVYAEPGVKDQRFSRFAYLESLAASVKRGHQVGLVLTGDSHHYSRFREGGLNYITCGGGGAFLHPTHQLKAKMLTAKRGATAGSARSEEKVHEFVVAENETTGKPALYPSRATSWRLSLINLAFPLLNPLFALTLFFLYLTFNWMLNVNARILHDQPLVRLLIGEYTRTEQGKTFQSGLWAYVESVGVAPWTVLMMIFAWAGYYYFADFPHNKFKRFLLGTAHWVAQTVLALVVTWYTLHLMASHWAGWMKHLSRAYPEVAKWLLQGNKESIVSLVLATLAAALASAMLFGLYLIVCLAFGRHGNEAFSSLRIANFKAFLRLRIDEDERLHVHAVGLDAVPRTRRIRSGPLPDLHPHLIETVSID